MTQSRPRFVRPGLIDRTINRLFDLLVRWGFGLSHNCLLQVRGRTSGRVYYTPVADVEKPEILKTYLSRYRTTVQRYFPVPAGSPLESFSNLASMYRVF